MTDFEKEILDHHKQLQSYALHLTHDSYLAEELLQDTILRLLSKVDKYEDRQKFGKWAGVIMHRSFCNSLRENNEARTRAFIVGYDEGVGEPSLSVADNSILYGYTDIMAAIHSLPPDAARLLCLRAEGYKYEEIAAKLGIPLGTVKSRLLVAKAMLKKVLDA